MRRIVPIVEGHSEQHAIPQLLRRILNDKNVFDVEPAKAIREHRQRIVKRDILTNRLHMARLNSDCAAIIVVIDCDDDKPCELAPTLVTFAREANLQIPCSIVLAVREIESWLIAGIESLRGYRGIPKDASPPPDVEEIRGAKEWLNNTMLDGYKSTIDQVKLLLRFDYQQARKVSPSLDKFLRELDSLIASAH